MGAEKMRAFALAALVAGLIATPAVARDVAEGDVSLTSSDLTQFGRLARNGVPQDFSGGEAYPGEVNPTTRYYYTTIAAPFTFNATQDVYYGITFDDDAGDLFASAYDGAYDPTNKALNWLGDAGQSGNYIFYPGLPGDALFFGVKVAAGGSLTLVVNSTAAVPTSSAHYIIQAFSDSEYDEDFPAAAAVPEPASWALMIAGFGAVGATMRRRRPRGVAATV